MLQLSSGLFSLSPGLRRILSRFLTSSIKSLAALLSSNRSLRTINLIGSCEGCWVTFLPVNPLKLESVDQDDEAEEEVVEGLVYAVG